MVGNSALNHNNSTDFYIIYQGQRDPEKDPKFIKIL